MIVVVAFVAVRILLAVPVALAIVFMVVRILLALLAILILDAILDDLCFLVESSFLLLLFL